MPDASSTTPSLPTPPPRPGVDAATALQRARLAWGVACICGLFLLETSVVHRLAPHPASPWIWSGLGFVAVVAVVRALVWGRRARQAGQTSLPSSSKHRSS
ncbi:MAG: hypothetical protein ACOVQT_14815 [Rubrivivax sp.]|jgi:hypothetical protein